MPDPKTIERLRGLVLSANDLKGLTDWPDVLIEDYLNILDNLILLANTLDSEIDQKLEEISTDFTDGSVPFVEDGLLVEDNTNFFWDSLNNILTALNIITERIKIANDGLQILDTDGTHVLTIKPGSDLTENRIYTIITGDSNRTITLQGNPTLDDWFDQSVKIAATPIFAGLTLASVPLALLSTARITKSTWIDAAGIKPNPGGKPPDSIAHGLLETPAWQFGNEAVVGNQEYVSFNLKIPEDMDISVAPSLCVGWSSTGVSPGVCEWEFSYLYTAEGEDTTLGAQDTITVNEAAPITTDGLVITPAAGMDLPGATDICIHGKLRRLSAGGTDTIGGTVELHGVAFWYASNKLGQPT